MSTAPVIIGWKAVRGPSLVKLEIRCEDVIGPDPEIPAEASIACCAKVLSGGGRSFADTRIFYRRGRMIFPQENPQGIWGFGQTGIYFFHRKERAQEYARGWGAVCPRTATKALRKISEPTPCPPSQS